VGKVGGGRGGSTEAFRINGERLWQSLMEMARIGATPCGGVCRVALTDVDRQGRDVFIRWAREAGCEVEIDQMGNIFARRPGTDNALPPVLTGSHLDTQPAGGKCDEVYGVLAGLEVIRTLNTPRMAHSKPWPRPCGRRWTAWVTWGSEDATLEDAAAGCDFLLQAILEKATE